MTVSHIENINFEFKNPSAPTDKTFVSLRTSGRLLYESRKQLSGLIAILLLLAGSLSSAQNSANGLIYHGRVLKPNGDAMEDNNVRFEVRIYGREALPVAKRCLLYQEEHTGISMVGSKGSFEPSLEILRKLLIIPEALSDAMRILVASRRIRSTSILFSSIIF